MKSLVVALLVLVAGAGTLGAQTTWIVGGPNAQFQDIQAAIDAASPGDRIEVWPGTYNGFTLGKGLDVVGTAPGVYAAITIRSVPRGQHAVVDRIEPFFVLAIQDCAGSVTLRLPAIPALPADGSIRGSSDVAVFRCHFRSLGGLQIDGSRVFLRECVTLGSMDYQTRYGTPAMTIQNAHVTASGCTFTGGRGGATCVPLWIGGGGDGITGSGTLLLMDGCQVAGGLGGLLGPPCTSFPSRGPMGAAIALSSGSAARVTTDCVLVGAATPLQRIPELPSLELPDAVSIGGAFTLQLRGDPSSSFLVFADLARGHATFPGYEVPLLLTTRAIPVGTFPMDPTGAAQFQLTMPAIPSLQNVLFYAQAIVAMPQPPYAALSDMDPIRVR